MHDKIPTKSSRLIGNSENGLLRLQNVEFWIALFITFWIVALHLVWLTHAGPLWRDEADTADFVAMPTLGSVWHALRNDISPILFVTVARAWAGLGLNSDFADRVLGFLAGMGSLGVIWWSARQLSGKWPLLVLALYAANPVAIRVGDAFRPYGLGILLSLLTMALVWNFLMAPGTRAFLLAALSATLSVQCLYQNAYFILAFCGAAWVVALGQKKWKVAVQAGLIGLVAALSLLPYWSILAKGQMSVGFRRGSLQFDDVWSMLSKALQTSGGWMVPIWLAVCTAALGVVVFCVAKNKEWPMAYHGTAILLTALFYLGFLWILGLPPHEWYFLILMASMALAADSIFGGSNSGRMRMGRVVLSFLLTMGCAPNCYAGVHLRQSNVDLVAAKLKQVSGPADMIVVSMWYYSISLQRYLDAGRWTSLPPLADVRIHRYDLLKEAMLKKDPIGPVLDQAKKTLESGHVVWVAGGLTTPPHGQPPPVAPPYRDDMVEAQATYCTIWMQQLGSLMEHAKEVVTINIPIPGNMDVNRYENIPLLGFRGWQEHPPAK